RHGIAYEDSYHANVTKSDSRNNGWIAPDQYQIRLTGSDNAIEDCKAYMSAALVAVGAKTFQVTDTDNANIVSMSVRVIRGHYQRNFTNYPNRVLIAAGVIIDEYKKNNPATDNFSRLQGFAPAASNIYGMQVEAANVFYGYTPSRGHAVLALKKPVPGEPTNGMHVRFGPETANPTAASVLWWSHNMSVDAAGNIIRDDASYAASRWGFGLTSYALQIYNGQLNQPFTADLNGPYPGADITYQFGREASRWWKGFFQILGSSAVPVTDIYLQNAPHVTSDIRWKDVIGSVTEYETLMDAWGRLSYKFFQMKEAIALKGGDNARIHAGLIAQDIITAFNEAGLDWNKYGLISKEAWEAQEETIDEYGAVIQAPRQQGEKYSLRMDECFAVEMTYQRWRMDKIEAAIAAMK
ncbi:TPA: tail fiber domain-containing protein, partial [Raoultella ornithinolytica]